MDLLSEVLINFKEVILGACGGVVANLYHFIKKKDAHVEGEKEVKLDILALVINGLVGAFIAYTVGDMIPDTLSYRDGLVGLIGVISYSLMDLIESKLAGDIMKKFMK